MTLFQAAILGIVQGLTEFLPVSSSGHLILVPALLGWPNASSLAFDAAVNAGTVAAVLVALREDIVKILRGAFRKSPDAWGKLGWSIVLATIPAGLAAVLFRDALEAHARTPEIVAISLAVWGVLLFIADRFGKNVHSDATKVGWKRVLALGCAQALALVPGTSRSGVTITTARFLGIDRATAARVSFLVGLPILVLASLSGIHDVAAHGADVSVAAMLVGILTSFAAGVFAIRFLLKLFQGKTTYAGFAVYRVAVAALVWFLLVR